MGGGGGMQTSVTNGRAASDRSAPLGLSVWPYFPLSCPSLPFVRLLVSCQSGTQTQSKLSPETGIASLIRNPLWLGTIRTEPVQAQSGTIFADEARTGGFGRACGIWQVDRMGDDCGY